MPEYASTALGAAAFALDQYRGWRAAQNRDVDDQTAEAYDTGRADAYASVYALLLGTRDRDLAEEKLRQLTGAGAPEAS